jgi:serine/threonine-protein kinase
VAWIWGGIAMLVVILVGAGFWIFSLQAQPLGTGAAAIEVPELVGLDIEEAAQLLGDAELDYSQTTKSTEDEDFPEGTILEQTPVAGTKVGPGTTVRLVVSSGQPLVTVPNLAFQQQGAAQAKLEELGLVYGTTTVSHSPNVPNGVVMGFSIDGSPDVLTAATEVPGGSTINLIVSDGLVEVPDVNGKPIVEAKGILQGATLQLTVRTDIDEGCTGSTVTAQSLIGPVPQKSTVTLTYCKL